MLLDVDPRALPGCRIHTIQFQRAEEGNPLDDVIVKAHDKAGNTATLEVQVKRSITFKPTDPVFRKVTGQIKEASETPEFWLRSLLDPNMPRSLQPAPVFGSTVFPTKINSGSNRGSEEEYVPS